MGKDKQRGSCLTVRINEQNNELTGLVVSLCDSALLKEERPKIPERSAKEWDRLFSFASNQGWISCS